MMPEIVKTHRIVLVVGVRRRCDSDERNQIGGRRTGGAYHDAEPTIRKVDDDI
ncbi:hypothetical protein RYJ27_09265 [Microbacterium limosum]|uniref:Uncharacterized protein n=1 Tax=Microbacterium limosum TaxID=3079935 RepID=A0AAU0MF08_9MICO|nr:hypothetical protein [Microbacterium sp. Y20]WOQ68896.1 hypothetical protein RYJ27_09265 [Microbacterium sp. Y20]